MTIEQTPQSQAVNENTKIKYLNVLKSRLTEKGKTPSVVDKETEGIIYTRLYTRIFTGEKDVLGLNVIQFAALLQVLEWSIYDFEKYTGLKLPHAYHIPKIEKSLSDDSFNHYVHKLGQTATWPPDYSKAIPVEHFRNPPPMLPSPTYYRDIHIFIIDDNANEPMLRQGQFAIASAIKSEDEIQAGLFLVKHPLLGMQIRSYIAKSGNGHLVFEPSNPSLEEAPIIIEAKHVYARVFHI